MILGLHERWARDHPPPRAEADNGSAALRAEDNDVNLGNGGQRAIRGLIRGPVQANVTSVGGTQAQLEITQLKKFVDGSVVPPPDDDYERISPFHSAQLLTFMVISRCCSPVVQVALKPCRMREDAGFQAWQFIMKTYKATNDLYLGQLEQRLTNLEMGEHESATSYCNRAQQILADLRMAGVEYAMPSYITHVIKGLPKRYNLLRRMVKLPGVRKELDEDSLSSYIIEEEFALESEKRKEQLLPHANFVAPSQKGSQQQ
ncbi:unnamed protein product [Closterium sp. NIES-54]